MATEAAVTDQVSSSDDSATAQNRQRLEFWNLKATGFAPLN